MKIDYQLGALANTQAGFLGHQQLVDRGMSEAAIRYRVDTCALELVRRGLYRVVGIGGDYRQLLAAATAILPKATVSHESAAEAHDIPYIPRRRTVVTVHARTTHDFPGVTIHRSLDLADHHRNQVGGLWTTTPARTLIDLAAVTGAKFLARALDDELASGRVKIEELWDLFQEVSRPGRTGCRLVRQLLTDRLGDDLITASRLERVGMRVFRDGGLPRPEWQYPAPWDPNRRIDFAWPWCCVGCEADGRRWHTRVSDFQRDRDRDNLALAYNWRIFRFTWADFTTRPESVIAQLREAIA